MRILAPYLREFGGSDAVDAAVERFYERVLVDDRIKHFFDDVDMKRQADHQKQFLTYAFGGPVDYSGKLMRDAHQHLVDDQGLNDTHFDVVAENSGAALSDLGVDGDLIKEVASLVETTHFDVLCKQRRG